MLQNYGIPPVMVKFIHSLHDGMKVEVMVDIATAPEIGVNIWQLMSGENDDTPLGLM